MSKLRDLGEFALIDRLAQGLVRSDAVVRTIGDDCAVLQCGDRLLLATCDASLEGVHFRRDYCAPEDIGWRAAASALSDIGAMGGRPTFVLVTLACPPDTPIAVIDALYGGLRDAVQSTGAAIVGGDTTGSTSGVVVDVTVLGEPTGGRPLLRESARAEDVLFVTGYPGASAAGLVVLQQGGVAPELVRAHLHPVPRIREGQWLARRPEVHAMIDVSDGLVQDAGHIAKASGLSIHINSAAAPTHPDLARRGPELGINPTGVTLNGGEAYELAFTVDGQRADALLAKFRDAFPSLLLTPVGRCQAGPAGVLVDGKPAVRGGFAHFG